VLELLRLELRRSLRPSAVCAVLGLGFVLLYVGGGAPSEQMIENLHIDPLRARGLGRQGVWSGVLLFLAPILLLRAGNTVTRWRSGECDWLGSRPTRRPQILAATWAGMSLAALLLLGMTAALVEGAQVGSGDEETFRYAGSYSLDEIRRLEPGETTRWTLPDPGETQGERQPELRVLVTRTLGNAISTGIVFGATRAGISVEDEHHIMQRGRASVLLPPGTGDVELSMRNVGEGSIAILTPNTFEVWMPASERMASMSIAVRAFVLLTALMALALGLGAWVGGATAAGSALTLWLLALRLDFSAFVPGARLTRAIGFVGDGRLPEPYDLRALVGLGCALVLGMLLGVRGIRSWRHGS